MKKLSAVIMLIGLFVGFVLYSTYTNAARVRSTRSSPVPWPCLPWCRGLRP